MITSSTPISTNAAEPLTVLIEDHGFRRHDLVVSPDVPLVGVLGDHTQGLLLTTTADQDRQVPHRRRRKRRLSHLVVLTVEVNRLSGSQSDQNLERFLELVEPIGERAAIDAIGDVFVLLPSRAEPEHHSKRQGRSGPTTPRGLVRSDRR